MSNPPSKSETRELVFFIDQISQLDWAKYVRSQLVIEKNGNTKIYDGIKYPPYIVFRFVKDDPVVIRRLENAIDQYAGKIKWYIDAHKRIKLPGVNRMIAPARVREVNEIAKSLKLSSTEYLAQYEPTLGPLAYEDLPRLTEHVKKSFPEVIPKNEYGG